MEGKESQSCCPPGVSCGVVNVPVKAGEAYCKCGPGWSCVIRKIDDSDYKPFYSCSGQGCVCITEEKGKQGESGPGSESGSGSGEKQIVKTEGVYCECPKGYACTITKTEGADAGKVFIECGNGCKCEIPGSDGIVVLKDA